MKFKVQRTLEKSEYLFNKIAPEEKPYDYKYQARELLEKLLKNEIFSTQISFPEILATKGIIHHVLGINFVETEETSNGEK